MLTVQPRTTWCLLHPGPQEGQLVATQHLSHSGPQDSTARVTQTNSVHPARGHRTMLQVRFQSDLRHHPTTDAGATQQITCQRTLGPYRELHTRGTVHMPQTPRESEAVNWGTRSMGEEDTTQSRYNKGVRLKADPDSGLKIFQTIWPKGLQPLGPQAGCSGPEKDSKKWGYK